MTLDMRLQDAHFEQTKSGVKKIALRLFDEKRAKLNLGDNIVFHKVSSPDEVILVKVTGLLRYNTFDELCKDINTSLIGDMAENLEEMHKIYSWEREKEYGVLGIRFELV